MEGGFLQFVFFIFSIEGPDLNSGKNDELVERAFLP